MALVLNFSITDLGSSLTFKELTAAYAGDNLTGWGAPNPVIGDATSVLLKIGVPGSLTMLSLDLSDTFPTTDITDEFSITKTLLGVDLILGGVYKFVYEVIAGATTYTTTKYYFIDKNVENWFDAQMMGLNINKFSDAMQSSTQAYRGAFDESFDSLSRLYMLFTYAQRLAAEEYVNQAQEIMDYINPKITCC